MVKKRNKLWVGFIFTGEMPSATNCGEKTEGEEDEENKKRNAERYKREKVVPTDDREGPGSSEVANS